MGRWLGCDSDSEQEHPSDDEPYGVPLGTTKVLTLHEMLERWQQEGSLAAYLDSGEGAVLKERLARVGIEASEAVLVVDTRPGKFTAAQSYMQLQGTRSAAIPAATPAAIAPSAGK